MCGPNAAATRSGASAPTRSIRGATRQWECSSRTSSLRRSRTEGRGHRVAVEGEGTGIADGLRPSAREAIGWKGGAVAVIGEPRKIGPRRLAAKTAKRTIKEEGSSPRSGEEAAKAQVGRNEKPETEESTQPKES